LVSPALAVMVRAFIKSANCWTFSVALSSLRPLPRPVLLRQYDVVSLPWCGNVSMKTLGR